LETKLTQEQYQQRITATAHMVCKDAMMPINDRQMICLMRTVGE
jgi:hypothetical protein